MRAGLPLHPSTRLTLIPPSTVEHRLVRPVLPRRPGRKQAPRKRLRQDTQGVNRSMQDASDNDDNDTLREKRAAKTVSTSTNAAPLKRAGTARYKLAPGRKTFPEPWAVRLDRLNSRSFVTDRLLSERLFQFFSLCLDIFLNASKGR